MSKRADAIEYAKHWIGRWYKWGGDDPSGFDCSGYVLEILQSVGLVPHNQDFTAADLFDHFKDQGIPIITELKAGCLVFWKHIRIYHVEFAINDYQLIGAKGGGSNTKTVSDAIRDNAFIKIRPYTDPMKRTMIIDPFSIDPANGG